MTDATATPTAPVALVAADQADADEARELVELVGSGWVRMHIGGRRYRLRRPFFGELRTLRMLYAEVSDEISARSFEAQELGREIEAEGKAIDDDEGLDASARATQVRKLRARSLAAGRNLTDAAEDLRLGWWTAAFETLNVDGVPGLEQWPGWIVDHTLPDKVLQHWRSAPLDRG